MPHHFVGTDEDEAVDFVFQLEGKGEEVSGVRGAVVRRWVTFLCVAGVVDEAEFDIHAAAAAAVVRSSATVRQQVGGHGNSELAHDCGCGASMYGDESV